MINPRIFWHICVVFAVIGLPSGKPSFSQDNVGTAAYLGSLRLSFDKMWFGGWSAIELGEDGSAFTMISDRGRVAFGKLERHNGVPIGYSAIRTDVLRDAEGKKLRKGLNDAEGLAISDNGRTFVSFEGNHRIAELAIDARTYDLPSPVSSLEDLPGNGSFKALAINAQSILYALPEQLWDGEAPFPLYTYAGNSWKIVGTIPRAARFLPVGADFGPDGAFYLLERDFLGLGFRSQVRRFRMNAGQVTQGEIILHTKLGLHDNLEGLSVWRDDEGRIRLTMISDDNFRLVQVTEIVEYALSNKTP